jgi:5'-nucleotidase
MKILLTNDDSYDAEGLQGLYAALAHDHECAIVAPDIGRSCCGHAVTNGSPIQLERRMQNGWSVSGTPADCVRVALLYLNLKPDLVISGLNQGGNLGVDILYSGTVAAAREATIMGVRSIAMSQYMRRDIERDWHVNGRRARQVLDQIMEWPQRESGFWSINLPALPREESFESVPMVECTPEAQPLKFDYQRNQADIADEATGPSVHVNNKQSVLYQSNYQARPRSIGSDVDQCFSGKVTASWITLSRMT